jgi:hypothetical protein
MSNKITLPERFLNSVNYFLAHGVPKSKTTGDELRAHYGTQENIDAAAKTIGNLDNPKSWETLKSLCDFLKAKEVAAAVAAADELSIDQLRAALERREAAIAARQTSDDASDKAVGSPKVVIEDDKELAAS